MRVLGISPLDKDATVSFVENGRIVFACAEERLSRVKMQDGFPARALALGLERTGWKPADIDAVAYAFFDGETEARLMRESFDLDRQSPGLDALADSLAELRRVRSQPYQVDQRIPIPGFDTIDKEFMPPKPWYKRACYDCIARFPRLDAWCHRRLAQQWIRIACAEHARWSQILVQQLQSLGLDQKLRRVNHHDAHAANAFHASGFPAALVVSFDGYGSGNAGGIYHADHQGIQPLHRFPFPNSLGLFYEHVTSGLGFRVSRHEGKIVGLAAYGQPDLLHGILRKRFRLNDGNLSLFAACNHLFPRALAGHFAKRDIAAAYQHVLELVATDTIRYWLRKTNHTHIALSGGVHANVKLNQRIREIDGVQSVFVYPNMGDGGCASGAAFVLSGQAGIPIPPLDHAYLGPDFSTADYESQLRAHGLAFDQPTDLEARIADLLADNNIVGRFDGRMEYGPRALGNRSILYPAQDPQVNQWLNHQLKRTEFMPFAPVCLAEHAPRLFHNLAGCEKTSEFMTITFNCTELMRSQCPAAVHVDGTARPQIVRPDINPSLCRILSAYHQRTGFLALINTSFNMHEEPIVCSPADAIRAFLDGSLHYLALGPFLVPHPRRQHLNRPGN